MRQKTTATCLFDTAFLMPEGIHAKGDHREGLGDLQKREADEVEELREDEDDEEADSRENLDIDDCDGVASSFGDLSMKGSRGGELRSRWAVLSRKAMTGAIQATAPSE